MNGSPWSAINNDWLAVFSTQVLVKQASMTYLLVPHRVLSSRKILIVPAEERNAHVVVGGTNKLCITITWQPSLSLWYAHGFGPCWLLSKCIWAQCLHQARFYLFASTDKDASMNCYSLFLFMVTVSKDEVCGFLVALMTHHYKYPNSTLISC